MSPSWKTKTDKTLPAKISNTAVNTLKLNMQFIVQL